MSKDKSYTLKDVTLSSQDLRKLYGDMLLIRRFEERCGQLYGRGLIGGFCHLYIGQEAVVVGIQSLLKPHDSVITGYRDHGHMLACGMDPNRVMAELTGRKDGYSQGKGGSMHMFSREKNFFGGHGIVGAQISLGTGMAFAHKYLKDGGLTVAYMGDGALNQGQVYESFNMAALWELPILYVVENNQYAMGTSTARHTAGEELCNRGSTFGIPGAKADGMDIFAVREAAEEALSYVRQNQKPFLLEMDTYRYRGHSMSDPALYREKEEVQDIKDKRDPLLFFKNFFLKQNVLSEMQLKEIEQDVREVVQNAAKYAEDSPEPPEHELYTDILLDIEK